MIAADLQLASRIGLSVAIIHYDGHTASVTWAFETEAGAVAVTGRAPRQHVAVSTEWVTMSDLAGEPIRGYRFVLAPTQGSTGETYHAISDNRSWLGVYITEPSDNPTGPASVLAVIPHSPAAGILQPGDILLNVASSTLPAMREYMASPVIDQLASHYPGDTVQLQIRRDGTVRTVTITLGSLANPAAVNAGNNYPDTTGNNPEYLI
jgi:predicted metalloprotease with PDZ domain